MKNVKKMRDIFHSFDAEGKKNLWLIFLAYFLVLFAYPFLRATSEALYIDTFGAKATPTVWFLSVFALSFAISIFNWFQRHMMVQRLFLYSAVLSIIIFGISLLALKFGVRESAYAIYMWKEIYIVLLIHMILGYVNNFLNIDQAKLMLGFIGAAGSIGGVAGGLLTSAISTSWGTTTAMYIGCIFILLNGIGFFFTKKLENERVCVEKKDAVSPIGSLKGAVPYVVGIMVIIALSQFCINIANLEFNFLFEKIVPNVDQKSSYLGKFYSIVNFVSLLVQLFIVPFVLTKLSGKTSQLLMPFIYLFLAIFGLGLGASFLWSVAGAFILFKALDYSLFSASKELLYYPLSPIQKYGAKYLTDMMVYRFAKALISLVLIYYQSVYGLNMLMIVFLILWAAAIFYIFWAQGRIVKEEV